MLPEEMTVDSFEGFMKDARTRLDRALVALFGPQAGRDATAEAFAYGWEHWERVRKMDNPIGYLRDYKPSATDHRLTGWRQPDQCEVVPWR